MGGSEIVWITTVAGVAVVVLTVRLLAPRWSAARLAKHTARSVADAHEGIMLRQAETDAGRIVEVRTAYDRGDDWHVIDRLEERSSDTSVELLLLAASFDRVGAVGAGAEALGAFADRAEMSPEKVEKGEGTGRKDEPLRPAERAIARRLASRLGERRQAVIESRHPEWFEGDVGDPTPGDPTSLALELLPLRLANRIDSAAADARRNGRWNTLIAPAAAAVAATVGVLASWSNVSGAVRWVVVGLSLASALLSALLAVLKPAEREFKATERAGALSDLRQQVEVFNLIDAPLATSDERRTALIEAYGRMAEADGRPRPRPLREGPDPVTSSVGGPSKAGGAAPSARTGRG